MLFSLNSYGTNHPVFEDYEDEGEVLEGTDDEITSPTDNKLKIIVKTRNFTKTDKVKLHRAIEILEIIMNSALLKESIINYQYKGEFRFHQNNNMTNTEIYEHMIKGAEQLKPEVDHTMNFDLTMYRSWNPFSKVKGYTKPDTMRIWIHSKFYRRKSWSPVDVAANMAHEWFHKIGFGHDYYYNEDRPYSVPYAIGGLIIQTAKKLGLE